MRATKRWTALLLAGCMALALTACGSGEDAADAVPAPGQSESPAPSPADRDGKTFTACLGSELRTLDPAGSGEGDGATVTALLFEGLMKWSAGDEELADGVTAARLVPGMAKSYERTENDDGTCTYTFRLREAKWSDGKPVTAQNFVYAWQRLVSRATGSEYAYLLECVVNAKDVTAGAKEPAELAVREVDNRTLEVVVSGDEQSFLALCAHPATVPLRQDAVEAGGSAWSYSEETLVTNGPYRLSRWENSARLALERREDYYETPTGPESVVFRFEEDEAAARAWEAGELDFVRVRGDWSAYPEDRVQAVPYGAANYLTFQTAKPPFDDPRVRQAFALAIDREKLLEAVAPAGQTPAGALVPAGIQGGDGADFRGEGGDYLDPAAKAVEANRERARELLERAGHAGGAGLGEVEYLYNANPAHKAVAEALREMWQEALGVTVTLKEREWGAYLSDLHAGNFSLARGRWVADRNDPAEFLALWSAGNDGGYESADYASLLDQAARTAEPAERTRLLHRAEALLVGQDWALAPLYFESRGCALGDGWQGIGVSPLGTFFFTGATRD